MLHLDVSKNMGTPKSSILIGFSIINHPFWGTPIFANTYLNKSQQIQSECLPHKPHNLQNDFSSSIV